MRKRRSADAFERVLEKARQASPADDDADGASFGAPRVAPRFDFAAPHGGGGEARWRLAMDWSYESSAPAAARAGRTRRPDPACEQGDLAAAVAERLGFTAGMTRAELTERWRAFVWDNHPDRQPPEARERANVRVALANALYERAVRAAPHA